MKKIDLFKVFMADTAADEVGRVFQTRQLQDLVQCNHYSNTKVVIPGIAGYESNTS